MNRFSVAFSAATLLVGATLAGSAFAVTIPRASYSQASGICQGALPNYEGKFRKRPLAVANESTESAFVTCGGHGNANYGTVEAVELYVTNRAAADVDMSCTLVDGFVDAETAFADYFPLTVTATSGVDSAFSWAADGTFTQPAISCNVPAKVEVNMMYQSFLDEIGDEPV